ncbi:hypothetical protein [Celerinatantimonas sp. YJH-8]|uniref:hypothetical protein n=1 Tax=Celerinatantimonas sp. YJH-8 TaxID=3228714 RepID=UPI0038C051B8
MFKLDHLMIEVDQPESVAIDIAAQLGLPLAWALIDTPDYSSAGVNFGDINIEFIQFRKRFGVSHTHYSGLSGIAFAVNGSELACQEYLVANGFSCRVGEQSTAHTTITVEEQHVFPTVFWSNIILIQRVGKIVCSQNFSSLKEAFMVFRHLNHSLSRLKKHSAKIYSLNLV